MVSDRIFGAVATLVALAYIASATQIQSGFLADPVGPRTFPILIGSVAALCGMVIAIRPDPDPEWPELATLGALALSVVVLIGYAYALKPLGFLIPTALAAGFLSYQIQSKLNTAIFAGVGLSVGLFVLFKFALGLSLIALPKALMG